ncbi:mannose-6-phosphate isomerase, class I [Propionimicrobium sp. BV2F7]|uniref:mannose-6-phosphate isomerase, class I n=1 Tax=Propionimicrobium sp. BV2F7 TaxID=1111131 RepID=UPI0003D799B3|nr:mannose-6-phosphate isomerase, class I [Propionimicrobium sp. BV2F7]ETJ97000.1 mannose-6-phosphate isomerase, class I [Propionimicrobium sp. BV2F7]
MQRIVGTIRHYDWGSTDFIANLLGNPVTDQPDAEYWLGTHPSSPTQITVDGKTSDLRTYLANNPGLLGNKIRDEFGNELPYLVKILSASVPLSLQAHPNADDAKAGFERENASGIPIDDPRRTFKDPRPKPELIVALTPFDALVGFRDPAESYRLFNEICRIPELDSVIGPLEHRRGSAALEEVFLDALSIDEKRKWIVNEVVSAAIKHVADAGKVGEFARTTVMLDEHFPGDPSLLAALLLNRRHLKPGEALHVSPGTMHAYLNGSGVEVMASSDNVLRGGLTHKHIDVDALVQVVTFKSDPAKVLAPSYVREGVETYDYPDSSYCVWRINPNGLAIELPAISSARILLAIDGSMLLTSGEDQTRLDKGQAVFIAANEEVKAVGEGCAFLTSIGK